MFTVPDFDQDYSPGVFCGKRIIVTKTRILPPHECEDFFSKFNFLELARQICGLAQCLVIDKDAVLLGRFYTDRTLCIAISLAIKYASRRATGKQISIEDLKTIIEIAWGEDEKRLLKLKHPSEILNQTMNNQKTDEILYLLARYWCLFSCLWPSDSCGIAPMKIIEQNYGAPYRVILLFTLAACKDGYLFVYENASEFSKYFGEGIDKDAHIRFLEHFSCSMDDWIKEDAPPQYVRTPILRSGLVPDGMTKEVYFVPSCNYLIARVTAGMYHEMSDLYNCGPGKNEFKVMFGRVFEKYVFTLLNFYVKNRSISGAIKYGTKKNPKETVDFLLKRNQTLIMIEVKQASVYAKAQYTGDEVLLRSDLKKTVGKAVEQLCITDNLIKNGEKALHEYHDCNQVKKMIILNTPLYNANNICKAIIDDISKDIRDVFIINISEFESLLDLQSEKQDLWEMLEIKETKEYRDFDFTEFFYYAYPDRKDKAVFLKKYFNQIYEGTVLNSPG